MPGINREGTMRIYHQTCAGRLLDIYHLDENEDDFKLDVGEEIDDPAEHHCEGDPHTKIIRVE